MRTFASVVAVGVLSVAAVASPARAQGLTLPPSGDNQRASVSQWIGPVRVTITYGSPDVTGPNGEDRRGKIWGQLVPWGLVNLGFGTCGDGCPWRAGANENTVFEVSHPVLIEGKALPAGAYGLHMIPGEREWTLVFSRSSRAWGSFFYDPAQDALRVTVAPRPHAYTHWLTYEFVDRQPAQATAALQWEELEVPWTIAVENISDIYLASLREELTGQLGFSHLNWMAAAQYCLQNKVSLAEGLGWAQAAVDAPFVGQENFSTLQTLSGLQAANGKTAEADATLRKAIEHSTATPVQVHGLGRQLIAQGDTKKALQVFTANYERFAGAWPTNVGMARGLAAAGRRAEALAYAEKALGQAPDQLNRDNLVQMIEKLKKGEDVN